MSIDKYLFLLLALLSSAALANQPAGVLEQVTGTILIDRGNGYVTASNGHQVLEGDRLLLLENTKAVLIQEHGCLYRLQENSILIAQKPNPSACGDAMRTISGNVFAQALGLEDADIINDAGEAGFGALGSENATATSQQPADSTQDLWVSEEELAPPQNEQPTTIEAEEIVDASPAPAEEPAEIAVAGAATASSGISMSTIGGVLAGAAGLGLALGGGGGGGGGGGPPTPPAPVSAQ